MGVNRDLVHVTHAGLLAPGRGPGGCPRFWPYTQSWRHLRRQLDPAAVDPVSAVVAGPVPTVVEALVADGWEINPAEGGVHCLWGAHLPRRMTVHAALGPADERDHARLWAFRDLTILAAHHELRADGGGHRVTSWEAGRERLGSALVGARHTRQADSGVLTLPEVRSLPWDGRIWRFASPRG